MEHGDYYPFNSDTIVARDGDCVVIDCRGTHLCGYVAIENYKLPTAWIGDYRPDSLELLNIHGGLTYAEDKGDCTVFGFDCAHLDDDRDPALRRPDHVLGLARQMEQQIMEYARRHPEVRDADEERRMEILDEVRATAIMTSEPNPIALFCAAFRGGE